MFMLKMMVENLKYTNCRIWRNCLGVNQIVVKDFNNDTKLDIVIAGNLYSSEVETPRNDASNGLCFKR